MSSISSWCRWLFISCCLVGSSQVWAVTPYTWGGAGFGTGHPSAVAACQASVKGFDPDGTYDKVVINLPFAKCYWRSWNGELRVAPSDMVRQGDGCLPGTTYNATSGGCEAPPNTCASKAGQVTTWIVKYTMEQFLKATGKDGSTPNQHIDSGGCSAEINTKECGVNGDHSQAACFGTATFSGEQTPADPVSIHDDCTGDPLCPPAEVKFDASTDSSCSAITYTGNGASQYECITEEIADSPGKVSCGTVTTGEQTQWVCTAPNPTPTKDTTKTTEKVTETPKPDGSKEKVTETKTDETKCKDGKCTTTSTVNVKTETTNADGTKGPESETCTGPKCAEDGKQEEMAEEGEDEEATATGISCAETLACTGDAVQCALLRSQKEEKCSAEEAGDYDGKKGDIDALVSGPEFQLEEETTDFSTLFSTGVRFLPSACPADVQLSLSGGRHFAISWQPLCNAAEILSYLFVAMTSLFFIRYVGSALGGE